MTSRWSHLRDLLESEPDAVYLMVGGRDAGKLRSARSLLAECQDMMIVADGALLERLDTLALPVVEKRGLVSIAAGAEVFGIRMPATPLMRRVDP